MKKENVKNNSEMTGNKKMNPRADFKMKEDNEGR